MNKPSINTPCQQHINVVLQQLNGLIAGMESHSEVHVSTIELKTMRVLLGGAWESEYDSNVTPTQYPPVLAVPMGLFPSMDSLQQVIDMANSQLPIATPNAIFTLLMVYHNTLLSQISACKN
jgi:hypothetical protein